MPTENEERVLDLLSAVDYVPGLDPGKLIQSWGRDAVTVACEVALGSYPGLQRKVRTNAVAVLETITEPQALETVTLLVKSPDSDVSIRALRAAAGQKNASVVKSIAQMVQSPSLEPLVAVEAVKALAAVDSADARTVLKAYAEADPEKFPHRANALVGSYLDRLSRQ